MNIRGVDVRVASVLPRADIAVVGGQSAVRYPRSKNIVVWPLDEGGTASPSVLRAAYARVLKKALPAAKAGTLALTFFDAGIDISAAARIAAQEIFRVARLAPTSFLPRAIVVVPHRVRSAAAVRKVMEGYLGHIGKTLAWGPFVTVDTIIETGGGIVLIRRSNPPFGWAIPGGFLDYGETLEEAAEREAREETGLRVRDLRQMHTYSAPDRDERFQTITTVFVARAQGRPKAASDAKEAKVFRRDEWKKLALAFDHRKVLGDYARFKKK